MATDLEIRIGADLSEIRGALAGLQRDLQNVGRAAQSSGNNNAFSGLEAGARGALRQLGLLVAGFASLATAIKLIGSADELNTLNARLKIATSSVEEYNRAQVALFDLAQRSRASLTETVELYSKIAGATKEAGVGQETLLQVVETINQAVQLSGASTQAAQAALVQLGQGLASGTLRGEELNAVLEQTPVLADAIARGMGITRGELRKYGEEGKITAEQVLRALQAQRAVIAEQFKELPTTVGQSVTLVRNASLQLLGAFDRASGSTAGLAATIKDLAEFLASDAAQGAIIEFGVIARQYFDLAAEVAGGAINAIIAAFDLLLDAQNATTGQFNAYINEMLGGFIKLPVTAGEAVDLIIRAFREFPANIRAAVKIATINIAAFVESTRASFGALADYIRAVFDPNTTLAQVKATALRTQAAIEQARQESINDALREREQAINEAAQARSAAQRARTQARGSSGSTDPGKFKTTVSDKEKREAEALRKAQLDAEERLQKDSSDRQLAILRNQFDDSAIAAADYYRRREELELQAIDRAIAVERERAKAGGADRVKAEAEITLLERRKSDITEQGARDRAAFQKQLDGQLQQAEAQNLENQGRTADAARLRLQAQWSDTIKTLQAEGNEAGVKLIEGLINTGVSKAQFDELKRQADQIIAELERKRQDIEARVRLGTITPQQGRQEEAGATLGAIARLQPLNDQIKELALSLKDPALIAAADALGAALQRMGETALPPIEQLKNSLRASLADMQANIEKTVASQGVDALANLFTDLASGSKSAGDALRDFVRGFVQSMAQIAARAMATYLVLQLLDAIYPGLGKATAATMSAGVNHGGGMAGTGPKRKVNPLLFVGAPRYHSGGMVGLKPDERPAILQTGEEVLSRTDPRNQANGGSGVRVINVIDPSLVSDYMTSSAGEKSVLNILQRNPGAVRQVLA